jgi:phosphoribosylanthranilate isomerase
MSALWIKICGLTTSEAVAAAVAAGVDAVGFVFSESPRRITPQRAAQLAAIARGRLRCVAVTRAPDQKSIDEILEVFHPDVLQTDLGDLSGLKLPRQLEILPVVRHDAAPLPSRLLFEGPASGSGQTCDWASARDLARRTQLVLAGGLNCDNVAEAIETVMPFGVDVSSGVEARPGVKSAEKIAQFTRRARHDRLA